MLNDRFIPVHSFWTRRARRTRRFEGLAEEAKWFHCFARPQLSVHSITVRGCDHIINTCINLPANTIFFRMTVFGELQQRRCSPRFRIIRKCGEP
jgi:hypothetical protein